MRNLIFLFLIITLVAMACSKGGDTVTAPTTPPVTTPPVTTPPVTPPPALNCTSIDSKFGTVISVIIQNSCATSGCHSAGSSNGPGALTNFTQINASASSIRNSVESGRMPKGSSLTTAQKQAISCWVESGAPNN
jgi:uncharacterized membrane protein